MFGVQRSGFRVRGANPSLSANLFKVTKFSYFFGQPSCFFQKYAYLCNPLHKKDEAGEIKFDFGEMAEWSNAAVLKTVDLNGSGGSNPSLSAERAGQKWSANGQKATNQ